MASRPRPRRYHTSLVFSIPIPILPSLDFFRYRYQYLCCFLYQRCPKTSSTCISNFMPLGQGVHELQDENQTRPKGEFGTIGESARNPRASLNSHNSGSHWPTVLRFREDNHPVVPNVHAKFRVDSIKRSGDTRQGFAHYPCNIIPSATENFNPPYLDFLSYYRAQILRINPHWSRESVRGVWSPSCTPFQNSISRKIGRRGLPLVYGPSIEFLTIPNQNLDFGRYQCLVSNSESRLDDAIL